MKQHNIYIILFFIFTISSWATTYEDAEDKKSNRWQLSSASLSGKVSNVYDKSKSSRVIQFKGDGTKSTYMLMLENHKTQTNKNAFLLQWEMKYSEDFSIIVGVQTEEGRRYLIYTPGNKNGYMQFALGENALNGRWNKFTRDIEKDIKYFEAYNSVIKVDTFVIRGNGYIDNIELSNKYRLKREAIRSKKMIEASKKDVKPTKKIKKVTKKVVKKLLKKMSRPKIHSKTNSLPKIYIKGKNPMKLDMGEVYVEEGVTAQDKEDGELTVISSENIDINKAGRYTVIYIAKDSKGDCAVDRRYVDVGGSFSSSDSEDSSSVSHESESNSRDIEEDENDDLDDKFDEREIEIAEWEKELALREKEIADREERLAKERDSEEK